MRVDIQNSRRVASIVSSCAGLERITTAILGRSLILLLLQLDLVETNRRLLFRIVGLVIAIRRRKVVVDLGSRISCLLFLIIIVSVAAFEFRFIVGRCICPVVGLDLLLGAS